MRELKIPRDGATLHLDPVICLGCAGPAGGSVRAWFEGEPTHGLVSSARAMARREVLDLPACAKCQGRRSRLRWVTALWFLLGIVLTFLPAVVAVTAGLVPDSDRANSDWRVWGVGFLLAVLPLHLGIEAWQAKDRGGLGVDLVRRDPQSVTLLVSDAVAERIDGVEEDFDSIW